MKKNQSTYLFTLIVTLLLAFYSCDDSDDAKTLSETYFDIENANFINSNFPEASTSQDAPVITSLYGNASVLAGGSNPLTINTSSDIKSVIVGVKGEKGYYEISAGSQKSTNSVYIIYLIISQELELENFSIVVAIIGTNELISSHEVINVSKVEAGTGKLQISCSWDKPNDVDLHLVEPDGTEIYYGNSSSSSGGELDVDSNADCAIDNINNENITYGESSVLMTGEYIVRVDLYSNCSVNGETNYIVTAHYNGQTITPTFGQIPYYGSFSAEDADYGGEGSGKTVLKFEIGSSKSAQEVVLHESFRFEYPADKSIKPKNLSPFK